MERFFTRNYSTMISISRHNNELRMERVRSWGEGREVNAGFSTAAMVQPALNPRGSHSVLFH